MFEFELCSALKMIGIGTVPSNKHTHTDIQKTTLAFQSKHFKQLTFSWSLARLCNAVLVVSLGFFFNGEGFQGGPVARIPAHGLRAILSFS